MYSKYYVLNDDGSFEYRFHHCTGTSIGKGKYKKAFGRIVFNFNLGDTLDFPPKKAYDSLSGLQLVRFEEPYLGPDKVVLKRRGPRYKCVEAYRTNESDYYLEKKEVKNISFYKFI
jgi:hypothetical protein